MLCISAALIVVVGVAAFMGLSKNGATNNTTSEMMASGEDHTLVVDDSGEVYAFGHNAKGELGDVTCENKSTPVHIEVPGKVVQVAAGDELSFALCKNGDLYAWGDDTSYQMGDGMNISRMEPEKIMEDVTAVAAGSTHAMAITKDGSLYIWGCNQNGALGISDSECDQTNDDGVACQSTPYKLMDNVVCISAGEDYSMAVTEDGTLYAWGYDVDGQLGIEEPDSTNEDGEPYQSTPAVVMEGVTKVACGTMYHALALTEDGDVYSWGKATVGSVGVVEVDNTEDIIQTTPVKVMSDVQDIAAGSAHSVALTNDGDVYTWGVNNFGQLGIAKGDFQYTVAEEDVYCQSTPKKVMENIDAICAGGFVTIVHTTDGRLMGCGSNVLGQLGLGDDTDSTSSETYISLS